ncbi:hypothetical protein TomTYG75_21150 [Sphingobium sp. TomTYG75]
MKSASSTYCTKEVADQNYEKIPLFARQHKFSAEISSLFKITVIEHDGYPENPLGIGKWINELQAKNTYFAQPKKEWKTYQKRVLKNPLFAGINLSLLGRNSDDDYKWVDDRKNEVVGYEITADLPYKHIEIHLEPNELSLAPESCYICPIVSRNKLAIFSGFCHFRYVGWDETKKASFSGWKASITEISDKNKINSSIGEILAQFNEHVIRHLTQEFLPPDTDVAEDGQDAKSDKAPD